MCAIGRAFRTVSGETASAVALSATVFCMVLGSTSVPELVSPGRKLRWIALFFLAATALVLAFRDRGGRVEQPLRATLWSGGWLAALALCSSAWSVDPRLSFERAASFALLIVTAGAFALSCRRRPGLPAHLLVGVLAGACAAAVAGLVLLVVAHGDAVAAASTAKPARFQGLGENPDTVAMLEGIAVPIAIWGMLQARDLRVKGLHLAALLLLLGTLSASGSRGGLLAAFIGGIVVAVAPGKSIRARLALALSVTLALGASAAGSQIPKPLTAAQAAKLAGVSPGAAASGPTIQPGQPVGPAENQFTGRLTDELYRVQAARRSLLTSSGRLEAWQGAIHQGNARPLLGYGFGTEDKVFIDRVLNFEGSYVENSFIGLYLQLGAVGLLSLVALLLAICIALVRLARSGDSRSPLPALAGVVVAGIALMMVQSYVYSVGNVATVAFWVVGFAGAGLAGALVGPYVLQRREQVDAPA